MQFEHWLFKCWILWIKYCYFNNYPCLVSNSLKELYSFDGNKRGICKHGLYCHRKTWNGQLILSLNLLKMQKKFLVYIMPLIKHIILFFFHQWSKRTEIEIFGKVINTKETIKWNNFTNNYCFTIQQINIEFKYFGYSLTEK